VEWVEKTKGLPRWVVKFARGVKGVKNFFKFIGLPRWVKKPKGLPWWVVSFTRGVKGVYYILLYLLYLYLLCWNKKYFINFVYLLCWTKL
jgi:hypothetical protein